MCALALAVCLLAAIGSAPTLAADHVGFEQPTMEVIPGQPFSMLALMTQNTTPLRFYSLDFEVLPQPGATGKLVGDDAASNFYLTQNLIKQGGGTLSPVSQVIQNTMDAHGNRGLVVNGMTLAEDNVAPAVSGVSDVLAQLVFDVSSDASGFFTIQLDELGSTLLHRVSDGPPPTDQKVPFTHSSVTIEIVPEPGSLALLAGAACLLSWRRRFRAR